MYLYKSKVKGNLNKTNKITQVKLLTSGPPRIRVTRQAHRVSDPEIRGSQHPRRNPPHRVRCRGKASLHRAWWTCRLEHDHNDPGAFQETTRKMVGRTMSNPLRGRVLIMSNYHSIYYSIFIISMSFFSLPYRLKLILAYKNLRKLKKGSLIWNCFKNGSTTASPPLKECFAAHQFTPQSAPQWTPAAWDSPNHWCNPQWIWARAHRTENEECATCAFPAKWSSPFLPASMALHKVYLHEEHGLQPAVLLASNTHTFHVPIDQKRPSLGDSLASPLLLPSAATPKKKAPKSRRGKREIGGLNMIYPLVN